MKFVKSVENRQNECISLSLFALVKAKESSQTFWKQTTELISISRSGAGFYLDRKCEVGRLVSLIMPMPRHLRCYDSDKELYRVWGLVQHCSPVSGDDGAGFHIGVAFTGKYAPPSYKRNPLQSYRIAGMNADGTWKIVEAQTSFVVRRHPRYWTIFEVTLSALDLQKNLVTDENAFTENVSQSGASVFSNLKVSVGDSVNVDFAECDFSAIAVVRNRCSAGGELMKLHLEFIEAVFPVECLSDENRDIFDEAEFSDDKEY